MADITMPQLGETVTEGTITRWFKQVGDEVAVDEALFEVSTDKVDTEVPSPVAGVLAEIMAGEGDLVEVGQVLARVGEAGEAPPAVEPVEEVAVPPAVAPVQEVVDPPAAPEPPTVPEPPPEAVEALSEPEEPEEPEAAPEPEEPKAAGASGGDRAVAGRAPADQREQPRSLHADRHRPRRPHHPRRRRAGHTGPRFSRS